MTGTSHSRLFWASIAAVTAVILLALSYVVTRGQSPTPDSSSEKLSIATPTVPHAALLYIAAAKGYFAEEGLEVTMMPAIHGKAAVELVMQGKADLGAASEVVLVLATAKERALAIAAGIFNSSRDLAVVARRERGIAVPRDLAGKRVGVTLGTAGDYFLWALLVRNKVLPSSVTLVDMPPAEIAQAITAGTIDAASTWQPNVLNAQLVLSDKSVTFHEPLAYTETFNIIGRRDFLKARSKAIEKLMRALLKAEQFNQARPEEGLTLVAKQLKVEVKAIQPSWKDFNFRVELRQPQLNTLEEEARWAMTHGYIETGPIPNFLPNLYLDALLAVQPARVTVMR
jgi:ABC-type nitrate/sulfonate/bicarbonate transport system substrate-binding protein